MRHPVTNFILFQLCWLANVVGAGVGWAWAGPLVTAVWIAFHLGAVTDDRISEGWLLMGAAAFGYAADSLLVLIGVIEFPAHARLGAPSTLWMVALWVSFAATLRHALRWLAGRYVLGAVLGAIGGPLAYRAGEALDAIVIPDSVPGLIAVSVEWLIAMPILLGIVALLRSRAVSLVDQATNQTERSC